MDKFSVCKEYAHERYLQIKLDEGKDQENFVDYVEAYFQLTPLYICIERNKGTASRLQETK